MRTALIGRGWRFLFLLNDTEMRGGAVRLPLPSNLEPPKGLGLGLGSG